MEAVETDTLVEVYKQVKGFHDYEKSNISIIRSGIIPYL